MNNGVNLASFIIFCLIFCPSWISAQDEDILTKEELLAGVVYTQSRISDLSVVYEMRLLEDKTGACANFAYMRIKMQIKGSKGNYEVTQGPDKNSARQIRTGRYDGNVTTTYDSKKRLGSISPGDQASIGASFYSDFALLNTNPSMQDDDSFRWNSLPHILRSNNTVVRNKLEELNGHSCHVVDWESRGGRYTIWIDTSKRERYLRYTIMVVGAIQSG